MYFVLYEKLKEVLSSNEKPLGAFDYAFSAFVAKTTSIVACYPHEVVRTRLRQECLKKTTRRLYTGFFQTLTKVWSEERFKGLYGGMGAHMMKQVPNSVIMF